VNALANPRVGAYLNEHFASAFQKVATFRIVNGQKQGGNVAAYFCAPDGRVLHCVAGPVDAETMLREAKWVVDGVRRAMEDHKKDATPFKVAFRRRHAERLRQEHGLVVEAATFDTTQADADDPLQFRDPSGRPLVPVLPPPPIDGPDVTLRAAAKEAGADAPAALSVADRKGRRWVLPNQGRVHQLLAAYSMVKIERLYGSVFENILGEKISTKPVVAVGARGDGKSVCLRCPSEN
jgi:hypothetical protein